MRPLPLALCFPLVTMLAVGQISAAPAARSAPARGKSGGSPTGRPFNRPSFDGRTGLAEPTINALISASARNDRMEITRLAERMGVSRFLAILNSADKSTDKAAIMAALDGIRVVDGGVLLLAAVSRLIWDPDPKVSERAARTVGDLLRADRLDKLSEWEVASEEVGGACNALGRAAEGQSSLQTRIAALEALGEAHAFCRLGPSLEGMTADMWPEVRRATLLAPQITKAESVDSIGALSEDAVPIVAGAAAVVWCRANYEALRKNPNGETEKKRLFRIRMLVLADVAPPEDTAELLPCLALSKDPEDAKIVELARKRLKEAPAPSPATLQSMPRW